MARRVREKDAAIGGDGRCPSQTELGWGDFRFALLRHISSHDRAGEQFLAIEISEVGENELTDVGLRKEGVEKLFVSASRSTAQGHA